MQRLVTNCLVIVGLINFLPVLGLVSSQKIESAYAVLINGNDLAILMRHRALLFGILGAFVLYAAFNPAYQPAAMLMAAVSMLGFVLLSYSTGAFNPAIKKIVMIDIAGIVILAIAAIVYFLSNGFKL